MTIQRTAYGQTSGRCPKLRGYPRPFAVPGASVRTGAGRVRSCSFRLGGGVAMI